MKAVFLPGDRRVEVRSVPDPAPGVNDVLVAVKASCICRSDLSLYYGNAVVGGAAAGKCVTGHEPAGIIEAVGKGVTQFKVGDRVAVYLALGCGACAWCRAGNMHLCGRWKCLGFTADGGNAEYLVVPERNCLRVPETMSFVSAAISTDAFGTLFSACRKLGASGGGTIGIWGLGPMGSAGVLAAKARGARVIALDPIAERRSFAIGLGADAAVDPTVPQALEELTELTGGAGLAAAIDCSGNEAAQNMALDATMPFGKVAFIGEAARTTIRPSEQLLRKQLTLFGSWYFSTHEYDDILRTIQEKDIDLAVLATHRFALDDAEIAFRKFDNRETEKAVFTL
ncbi:MAG: alcohol dehydrogenase catalytic domain-containing protein [Alphaproteobacteria bacterium]